MPRRNLYILVVVLAVSFVCYHKADSAHRGHYEPMFEVFKTVMAEIKDHYVEVVDERELFEGAMKGMVAQLDGYSDYSGFEETRRFHESLHQEFGGIGIEINWVPETKSLTVISPMVGTPAYEAGIMPGDKIIKIDDDETVDFLGSGDAVNRIKGKPGESVRLTILHPGETQPIELTVTRAIIKVDTVLGDRRSSDGKWDYTLAEDPRLGYIRITQFGDKTIDELTAALEQCRDKNIRGLILDLRNNPGGLLDAAYKTCDFFVKEGVIVTIRERGGKEREKREATGAAEYTDWPIAVLINRFSASASEIVAACLQDRGRAVVVGERSYGKGTVQSPIDLEGGKSMLRLTIANYWRPSNENIDRKRDAKDTDTWGVRPSPGFEVKVDDKQMVEILKRRRERDIFLRPGEKLPTPTATASPTPTAKPSATPSSTKGDAIEKPQAEPSSEKKGPAAVENQPGGDPQLQKAVEYLEAKLK